MSELIKALVAAQQEMKAPPLDGVNPHFNSKFSTLLAVRDTVIPTLNKHGIAVTQDLIVSGDSVGCRTVLSHTSGDIMEFGPLFMPAQKSNAHGYGSAATYARRYSLMAAVGLVGDPDDDANAAIDNKISPTDGIDMANVDAEQMHEYADQIKTYLDGGDLTEASRLWKELNREEQVFLWKIKQPHGLNTKQKDKLREAEK